MEYEGTIEFRKILPTAGKEGIIFVKIEP